MFRRKKKHESLTDKVIAEGIQKSEDQKVDSAKEIVRAQETVSILKRMHEENHIVIDLREVFGGR